MTITKEMSIMEVVTNYPDTVPVFMQAGMGCIGCAAAHFENIEQGAMAHGIDMVIANGARMEDLYGIVAGEDIGTRFSPQGQA